MWLTTVLIVNMLTMLTTSCIRRSHIYIYIYINSHPSSWQRLLAVAQSVERWSRDPGEDRGFNSQRAGGLGVAFFVTGTGWVLKCISF